MSKFIWKVLFFIPFVFIVWKGWALGHDLYGYYRFSASLPLTGETWSVEDLGDDIYAVAADYRYRFQKEMYQKHYVFTSPTYSSRAAAESKVKIWRNQSWKLWVDPKHPDKSTLQRLFPIKTMVHLALAVGVLLYFVWLHDYTKRLNS